MYNSITRQFYFESDLVDLGPNTHLDLYTKDIVMDTKKMCPEIRTIYHTILDEAKSYSQKWVRPDEPAHLEDEIRDTRKQLKALLA